MQLIGQNDASNVKIGIQIPGQATPPKEPVKLILSPGSEVGYQPNSPIEVQSGPGRELVIDGMAVPASELRDAVANPASRLILPEDKQVVDADGEATSSMTWPHFVERRRFSCRPRVINAELLYAFVEKEGEIEDYVLSGFLRTEQREDVIQATLEFVGEVGELSELIGQHGVKALWGDNRTKLIDECGDILFTGAWLIEAWATNPAPLPEDEGDEDGPSLEALLGDRPIPNPLLAATDTELYRFEGEDIHANLAVTILDNGGMALMKNRQFVGMCSQVLMTDVLQLMTFASLTSNAAKKLAYQNREQDAQLQIDRVMGAFYAVNFILCLANSNIEEAMIVNRAKIDARYPNGYFDGVNGGIRAEG